MGTTLPCAWAGAGTLAEYSVVGTGGTSTAAGLACRSHGHCWGREAPARLRSGMATGPRQPWLGTRGAGRAATAIDGTPLDLEAVMEIGEMEKTNQLEWRSYL